MRIRSIIFGHIRGNAMGRSAKKLKLHLKPLTAKLIPYVDVPKLSFSTLMRIQRLSLGLTDLGRLHRERWLSGISQQEDILNGTKDVSGIGLRWVGYSPVTSLKAQKSLQKL